MAPLQSGKDTPAVAAVKLSKQYGNNKAIQEVSFTIGQGEIVGLIGPNGAGKSTTMNILCGYLAPTAGSVSVCGIEMSSDPEAARRHIGYLPEIPPVYPDMTVEEQVRFACRLSGMKKGKALEETVQELCEKTHIAHMRSRLIKSLSKGYRQRVAVAQLLAGDPDILMLDEPTVGLDPRQIREFRELLLELGKTHTVLFSSHILSEINSICDRVLIFEKGQLIADGRPEELRRRLQPDEVVRLQLAGGEKKCAALQEQLGRMQDVKEVICTPESGGGTVTLDIVYSPEESFTKELNGLLRRSGCDLLRMEAVRPSLEELYLKITERKGGYEDDI